MKKVYISGPMRGYPLLNYPAFYTAEEWLRKLGYHPVNPAVMDCLFEGWDRFPPKNFKPDNEALRRMLRRDLDALLNFEPNKDGIYMLRGWEKSSGANAELAVARFMSLEEMYE